MNSFDALADLNRRDFIKGSSFASLMLLMGAVELRAEDQPAAPAPVGPAVDLGVIGCGAWGREILTRLATVPGTNIAAICDHYEAFLNRAKNQLAPKAATFADYKQLLGSQDIKAVIVATPSHLHKQIVLDALAAGKHVYCEAPMATTVDDSRAIAQAARKAARQYFQAGLLARSDPQLKFLLDFVRTGALGRNIQARSHWHKKNSWRKSSPNPERDKEVNWRLDKDLSVGLVGEIGIQQIDAASWIYKAHPVAVTGFGSTIQWTDDGREVPDSIQAVFEYPEHVRLNFDCTLGNTFEGMNDVFYGTNAALMIRDGRAWMFKEADAPLLGWEVYATKNDYYKDTGISLLAGASKLDKQITNMTDPRPDDKGVLWYALEAFVRNTRLVGSAVENFVSNFGGDDLEGLKAYVAEETGKIAVPAAGWKEGHDAAVVVIKANEAIVKRQRLELAKDLFEV